MQLGSTLKFVIDQFFTVTGDSLSSVLEQVEGRAVDLVESIELYRNVLEPILD